VIVTFNPVRQAAVEHLLVKVSIPAPRLLVQIPVDERGQSRLLIALSSFLRGEDSVA
jgi:hypothetical protein